MPAVRALGASRHPLHARSVEWITGETSARQCTSCVNTGSQILDPNRRAVASRYCAVTVAARVSVAIGDRGHEVAVVGAHVGSQLGVGDDGGDRFTDRGRTRGTGPQAPGSCWPRRRRDGTRGRAMKSGSRGNGRALSSLQGLLQLRRSPASRRAAASLAISISSVLRTSKTSRMWARRRRRSSGSERSALARRRCRLLAAPRGARRGPGSSRPHGGSIAPRRAGPSARPRSAGEPPAPPSQARSCAATARAPRRPGDGA